MLRIYEFYSKEKVSFVLSLKFNKFKGFKKGICHLVFFKIWFKNEDWFFSSIQAQRNELPKYELECDDSATVKMGQNTYGNNITFWITDVKNGITKVYTYK